MESGLDKRAVSKKTWSLVARMRLGLLLLFIPVLMLGAIYYLHMERSLQRELQQRLLATNHQLRHVFIEPYLHEMERQFTLIYDQVIGYGASLIQTDRPEQLLKYLREKGLHD
jgi:hypothetical protein